MTEGYLKTIARDVKDSKCPITRGKEILLDNYRTTNGTSDERVGFMARFEIVRSTIVQAAYEVLDDSELKTNWLEAGMIDAERKDAEEQSWNYHRNGIESLLKNDNPRYMEDEKNRNRTAIGIESTNYSRFLGSIRQYIPGVGYAISVRKRPLPNQDSFWISPGTPSFLAVADGCGRMRFSEMASHYALSELAKRMSLLLEQPKSTIRSISWEINNILNDPLMRKLTDDFGSGSSTLTLAIVAESGIRTFKVGDSLPFRGYSNSRGRTIENISWISELLNVMGQMGPLRDSDVEEYSSEPGQLILTTDGITNYLDEYMEHIQNLLNITDNSVLIAENIIRATLRNISAWEHSDDATVIVQDIRAR